MEENNTREGKDLAVAKAKVAEIEDAIINAKLLKINSHVTLDYDDDGIDLLEISIEKNGKVRIKDVNYDFKDSNQLIKIMKQEIEERNKFDLSRLRIKAAFNFNKELQKDPLTDELYKAMREGRAVPLRMGREVTEGENLHMMMNRMFGVDCHQMWRVRGRGTHDFKYIGIDDSGKTVEAKGSETREGTNPRQKITIMRKDGSFEEKTVDHMIISGRYAIITDLPDSSIGDRTVTGIAIRGPGETFLAIEALDTRNSQASNNQHVKRNMTRGRSVYETENTAQTAKTAEKVNEFRRDRVITTEELEIVKTLMDKGAKKEDVVNFLNFVHELKQFELSNTQIKAILDGAKPTIEQVSEITKNGISDEKEVKQIYKNMQEGRMSFEDALKKVKNEEIQCKEEGTPTYERDPGEEAWDRLDRRRRTC